MNDPKNKLPSDDTGMNPREIEKSIRRIENDLYFGSGSINDLLSRIEEKLENVVTKEDLEENMMELKAELISNSNATFRWTIGVFIMGSGVLLAILKIT